LGGKTVKMHQGHHGANHPVKDHTTGKVEIVSMNHGFAVDSATACPKASRRPMSRCSTAPTAACQLVGKPVFSVQHHPEASPGPQDSHYLFRRFMNLVRERKGLPALAER
jgi:carbamoyl-phosphate synthase small subunit